VIGPDAYHRGFAKAMGEPESILPMSSCVSRIEIYVTALSNASSSMSPYTASRIRSTSFVSLVLLFFALPERRPYRVIALDIAKRIRCRGTHALAIYNNRLDMPPRIVR